MNVVFVTRGSLPRAGGIEVHQQAVAQQLAEAGNSVTIFSARIDETPFSRTNTLAGAQRFAPFAMQDVATRPFPINMARRTMLAPVYAGAVPGADRVFGYHRTRERLLPLVVRALAPAFRRAFAGAAVVHAMGGEPQAHAALAAARALGVPFVITPFAHPGFWGDDELNLRLYREADAVIALLAGERDWLVANGVPADRAPVIGVPAPTPVPDPARPATAGPLVLFLGVKRRYKYKLLLDALPHVRSPNARFAFVGPETPDWRDDFAVVRDPRALAAGKVDDREKWGWLASCDLLCLPSVSEILPVSILEAWRMARPVVVASGRWTRDLVDDGRNGLITEPRPEALAEAVDSVLADPERARAMGEAGRAKVEAHYTAAVIGAAHERLYEALVGAKG